MYRISDWLAFLTFVFVTLGSIFCFDLLMGWVTSLVWGCFGWEVATLPVAVTLLVSQFIFAASLQNCPQPRGRRVPIAEAWNDASDWN